MHKRRKIQYALISMNIAKEMGPLRTSQMDFSHRRANCHFQGPSKCRILWQDTAAVVQTLTRQTGVANRLGHGATDS